MSSPSRPSITAAELLTSARASTLRDLVAGVAHEINTPLGALASNHDVTRRALDRLQVILEDEVVDADELVEVRRIVRAVDGVQATNALAVERMKEIVENLRTFGRPDRSEIDRVDVQGILESTLALLRHRLGDGVAVESDFAATGRIECFPGQLGQVFMNLLVNAVQAVEEEGSIRVRTRDAEEGNGEEGIVVVIEDTGVGIPPENLDRLFEPGFTTKGSRVGMGIGLLISREIVDRHGGRVEVESTPGSGSTFSVHLPRELP